MKFYSEVTKQLYDTIDQVHEAEARAKQAQAAEEEKKKVRAARAKEVENAYNAVLKAQQNYVDLKNKFIEDYGSFHMSFSHKTDTNPLDLTTLIDLAFNL